MAESETVSMHEINSDNDYTISPLTSGDEDGTYNLYHNVDAYCL